MSNELTLRNGDMIRSVPDLLMIAELLVKSKMLPQTVQTKEAAAAIILKGREIGMPVMESFALINVIQGKPTIAPQGMIALARRTRELEDLKIEDDGNTCTVTVKRKGQSPFVSTFSVKDAAAMGLSGKDNWNKQPKIMRQWRAISANFRITFPDVIGGMYTPEELGATVDAEGEVIEGTVVVESPVERMANEVAEQARSEMLRVGHEIEKERAAMPNIPPLPEKVHVPSHENGNGKHKAAVLKTARFPELVARAVQAGYVDEKTANYRLVNVAGAAGFAEITDKNIGQVWLAISKHYEDKRAAQDTTEPTDDSSGEQLARAAATLPA